MTDSADPDQLASEEANLSDLHCFRRRDISMFSGTSVSGQVQQVTIDIFIFFFSENGL